MSIRAICNCATVYFLLLLFLRTPDDTRLHSDSIIYIIYILATEFNAFLSPIILKARRSRFHGHFHFSLNFFIIGIYPFSFCCSLFVSHYFTSSCVVPFQPFMPTVHTYCSCFVFGLVCFFSLYTTRPYHAATSHSQLSLTFISFIADLSFAFIREQLINASSLHDLS